MSMNIARFTDRQQIMLKVECFIRREVSWDFEMNDSTVRAIHEQMCNELHAALKGLTYQEVFKSRIEPSPTTHKIEMNYDITFHNAMHFFRQGIIWAKRNGSENDVGLLKHMLNDQEFMRFQFNNIWERYRSG